MLSSWPIGVPTALLAGVISFLTPCVLPLVPGYVSYIAGRKIDAGVGRHATAHSAALSLCFVLGFSTVFTLLGASATRIGRLLLGYRYEAGIAGGAVIMIFGLFATGLVHLPWLNREFRVHTRLPGGNPVAAYILGLAFAFGWTPCIGPILGAILTIAAASASTSAIALLIAYSVGLGIPFIASALFADKLMAPMRLLGRVGRTLQLIAGAVMILMELAVMTGRLSDFSVWLLQEFPGLATIG